uniref:Integrase catalytic subunit n=1 Tax=gamma proteobacterium D250 TaxID=649546 RepID=M4HXH5_9GAMM|nr:integrase catalytic subunit [gamma proteobacterium D250]AFT64161.1 integrase catalytic subunit [gamma proteobacterium D250]
MHSGIRYVTPADRQVGKDAVLLSNRNKVYQLARERNPLRWSGDTRNWRPIGSVALNPQRAEPETKVAA